MEDSDVFSESDFLERLPEEALRLALRRPATLMFFTWLRLPSVSKLSGSSLSTSLGVLLETSMLDSRSKKGLVVWGWKDLRAYSERSDITRTGKGGWKGSISKDPCCTSGSWGLWGMLGVSQFE